MSFSFMEISISHISVSCELGIFFSSNWMYALWKGIGSGGWVLSISISIEIRVRTERNEKKIKTKYMILPAELQRITFDGISSAWMKVLFVFVTNNATSTRNGAKPI